MDDEALGGEAAPELRRQVAINLDCVQLCEGHEELGGQGAGARADLDHRVGALRVDRRRDPREVVAIGEEMLAEALPGPGKHG